MKIIFDYNRTIFDPNTQELYPGVFKLLKQLSINHDLFLISKNEFGRRETLDNLGIIDFFQKIFFVENKTIEIFKKVSKNNKETLIIGDRIRGEIVIGNKLNFITVWLKQGKFSNEEPINEEQKPKYIINDILELKKIIKKYEKQKN